MAALFYCLFPAAPALPHLTRPRNPSSFLHPLPIPTSFFPAPTTIVTTPQVPGQR